MDFNTMLLEFSGLIVAVFMYLLNILCKLAQCYYTEKLKLSMVSVEGPYTKIPGYARQLRRTVYKRYIYKKQQLLGW